MQEQISAVQKLINTAIEFCVNYSFQVLGAVIVLGVGFLIAGWTSKVIMQLLEKKKMDVTLSKFLAGTVRIIIIGFTLLVALGKFGITIAPFVAALGALAFGASFAIQGPLSNYGAGLSIILSRPFVVGDTITVAGVSGVVKDVKLACTILTNEDGIFITIPSKDIVGQILHNSKKFKVVEGLIGISYDSNPEAAVKVITSVLQKFPDVTQDPKFQVGIQQFADSAINVAYRYWVPTIKFFQLSHEVNAAVYQALQQANIKIPFPQRELRILSGSSELA